MAEEKQSGDNIINMRLSLKFAAENRSVGNHCEHVRSTMVQLI